MNPVTENNRSEPTQPQDTEPTQAKNLPLRGMAMILIAVAVLLALWGAYAAYRPSASNDSSDSSAEATATVAVSNEETQEVAPQAEEPAPSSEAPEAQPVTLVHVLNNSTIQGLAAEAAGKVASLGWEAGETGNYAESILSQNTVFYSPETPGAEEAAQRLAEQTGAVVATRAADLPASTNDPQTLVLVLTQGF